MGRRPRGASGVEKDPEPAVGEVVNRGLRAGLGGAEVGAVGRTVGPPPCGGGSRSPGAQATAFARTSRSLALVETARNDRVVEDDGRRLGATFGTVGAPRRRHPIDTSCNRLRIGRPRGYQTAGPANRSDRLRSRESRRRRARTCECV